MPSSTTYSAISVAMRRTISRRWATAVTSRTVTRSSISSAESVPATSSRRSLYRSRVASAWFARDRIAADSSRTRRSPFTYSAISRMDWLTDDDREVALLGDPVRRAVAGAGLLGGDRRVRHELHTGPVDLGDVLVEDQRAVELAQLAQPRRGELDVQDEAARAHRVDGLVEAEHDQTAGVAAQDALQAVAERVPGATALSAARISRFVTGARAGLSG